jgi:hypothetical protein
MLIIMQVDTGLFVMGKLKKEETNEFVVQDPILMILVMEGGMVPRVTPYCPFSPLGEFHFNKDKIIAYTYVQDNMLQKEYESIIQQIRSKLSGLTIATNIKEIESYSKQLEKLKV